MKDKTQLNEKRRAVEATGQTVVGNFVFGDWAGEVKCRHGHDVRLFNIGRGHWAACDTCRTYIHIGSNLMSAWRSENESIWRANHESTRGYRLVGLGSAEK